MIIGPAFEHAFDLHLDFHSRLRIGPLVDGNEVGFVGVAGGTIEGPRLSGRVLPNSGGDYANIRSDGVVEVNAHYLLEAVDGTMIHVYNRGYSDRSREGFMLAQATEGSLSAVASGYYFRVTPVFKTVPGPHEWLTRTVLLGVAERYIERDYTVFRYYIVK